MKRIGIIRLKNVINSLKRGSSHSDSKKFSTLIKLNDDLQTKIKDDIFFIKLNRPDKRNCLNFETIKKLKELLIEIDKNERITKIVLHGEGNNFCSGFDLNEIKEENKQKLIHLYLDSDWFKSRKLLIAFVQGYAVGLGFELALACDILIADESVKFGFLNRRFGLPSFLPLHKLTNLIGRLKSIEFIDNPLLINSKEAINLGLIKHSNELPLDQILNSIELPDDKQLKNKRLKLNSIFRINKFPNNVLPDEWKTHNLNSSNYNTSKHRHGKYDLSFWKDVQLNLE